MCTEPSIKDMIMMSYYQAMDIYNKTNKHVNFWDDGDVRLSILDDGFIIMSIHNPSSKMEFYAIGDEIIADRYEITLYEKSNMLMSIQFDD